MVSIELNAEARTELRRRLRKHRHITRHVKTPSEVNGLRKGELVDLAVKLRIDLEDVLRVARFSPPCPFAGQVETEITFGLFGKSAARRLRVTAEMLPEWPYFDIEENAVVSDHEDHFSFRWELFAIRESVDLSRKGRNPPPCPPEWIEVGEDLLEDGVIPGDMKDQFLLVFDLRFQKQNEARLDAAGVLDEGERSRIREAYFAYAEASEPEVMRLVESVVLLEPGAEEGHEEIGARQDRMLVR